MVSWDDYLAQGGDEPGGDGVGGDYAAGSEAEILEEFEAYEEFEAEVQADIQDLI